MRSRLSLLCAVEIVSVANFLTIASDISNQNEVVDWHDNKSVGRTLVTVDDEMRMPVNALVTRLNEISRENVVENLETVVESVATSFAQNSESTYAKFLKTRKLWRQRLIK
ncbi:RxLR-like protein [Plasmopara halstedii]|uniref:RxLR-like protein n=1 Tax=Plasmopara halstedii TaxID=4781 RepID=A0A0P1AU67_PLAHL|nr:RxLR-like protein [Plasmopara halstedii]CEG44246.1 RxLR-like protein [Plasmopara halstedii]|eukprot:XP_024580615.1 RxLR-like protein [Plasmopara halstedii]